MHQHARRAASRRPGAYTWRPLLDATPAPAASLTRGSRIGWLTVLVPATLPGGRSLVRCDCGTKLNPRHHLVARGVVRDCGTPTRHGVWGW